MEKALKIVVESVLYPFHNFGKIITLLLITALAMAVISLLLLPILPDIAAGKQLGGFAQVRIVAVSILAMLVTMPLFRGVVDNVINGKDISLGNLDESLSFFGVILKLILVIVLPLVLIIAAFSFSGMGSIPAFVGLIAVSFAVTVFLFTRYVMTIGLHVDKQDASLAESKKFSTGNAVLIVTGVFGTLIVVRMLQFLTLVVAAAVLPDLGSQVGLFSGLLTLFVVSFISLFTGSMAMAAIGKTYLAIKSS